MRLVAGFHTRDDEWILPTKLRVLSRICDVIVVCLDRPSEEVYRILADFPKVDSFVHENTLGLPDSDDQRGPLCEEGRMRQETWDRIATHSPDYVLLGDTDELPTPDLIPFLDMLPRYPEIDIFKAPIVNLYKGTDQYISGRDCIWSPEHPKSNKRGFLIRYNPKNKYTYPDKPCHVPTEPSIEHPPGASFMTKTHLLQSPRVLHYKFANWERWLASVKARMPKYERYWEGLQLSPTPAHWLWSL